MPLPLAVSTLLSNSRHQIVVSQAFSGVVAVLLGPGCLIFSFMPIDALPEYRTTLMIGGTLMCLLLAGLVVETRRKLAGADRIIQALDNQPDTINRIFAIREKSNYAGSYRLRIELKDGSAEVLPINPEDYPPLINFLRAKFPSILRESAGKPVDE